MAPQAFAAQYSRDCQGNAAVSPTKVVQNAALTPPNWRETIYIHQMSHIHNCHIVTLKEYTFVL